MRKRLLLAVAALSIASGCKPDLHGPWPQPKLAAHRTPPPADGDGLAAELELGQKNFFALQEYYLGMGEAGIPKKKRQVHELTSEEAAWVGAAVVAESQALGRLLPLMEKALTGKVAAEDRPEPAVPNVSLAILSLDASGPWDLAQARANYAGNLAYLYRVRRAKASSAASHAQAKEWARQGGEELARIEKDQPAAGR